MRGARPPRAATAAQQMLEQHAGRRAAGPWAMSEIITYSFISPTYYDKIRLAGGLPRCASP